MKNLIETFKAAEQTQFECPDVRQSWHKDRTNYAIWKITPPQNVVAQIQILQEKLKPWIIPLFSPHITICVCGFTTPNPQYVDDVAEKKLNQQAQRIESLNSFDVATGSVSSFLSCPIVLIQPSTELMKLRTLLSLEHQDFREVSYTPHISLGLYKAPYSTSVILNQLKALPALSPIAWNVRSVELAEFEAQDPTARLYIRKSVTFKHMRSI